MVRLHGDVEGKDRAVELLEDKLDFIEDWVGSEPDVHVKKVKSGAMFNASVNFKLGGRKVHIESDNHRSLVKCFDELAGKAKALISRESDKVESKKRKQAKQARKEELQAVLSDDEFSELD